MWCQSGVSNGFWCLKDFLDQATPRGQWPDFKQFQGLMSSDNPSCTVSLQNGEIWFSLVHRTRDLYDHLTTVYHSVCARCNMQNTNSERANHHSHHAFQAMVRQHKRPLELWPRKLIAKISYHGPQLAVRHPTYSVERPNLATSRRYMATVRKSLRWITPVHADVWLRVIMCMLPVNERYHYCSSTEPERILCPQECGEQESIAHALRECPKIAPLWSAHESPWQQFNVKFAWTSIINMDNFTTNSIGRPYKDALFHLWVALTGVTLHLAWTQRNHKKHRRRAAPPHHVLTEQSFLVWMSTVRWWMRRQALDDPIVSNTKLALDQLLSKPPYSELRRKHPRCLDIHPTFDVH
ncbi:hypothetical protein AC1031_000197 [Aphanomyces cochlioides]|nr:hypothetical protein AC1031_000197 [Aphanomyces cochlioides]